MINGKEQLDKFLNKNGVIFISVHSGSYPLAGKIFYDNYPNHKIIIPFYKFNKYSIYETYKKLFKKININIIQLGGAMKEIDPVLKKGGSVCLFLDAALPVKNRVTANIFNNRVPFSTGALWLSKKYFKPIIPIYVHDNLGGIVLNVLPEIKTTKKSDRLIMKEISLSIEKMISMTLKQWHIADNFLFQDV
jgi:lauroyl/myristoyl acyltransferase